MKPRRKARQTALQILYKADISGQITEAGSNYSLELEELAPGTEARRYCEALVEGVTTRLAEIDALIEECSENWTIARMALVDRNILRIAAYELISSPDIPYKVVIDEAVELSKRFASEGSGSFINGILDHVHKEVSKKAVSTR